MAPYDVQTAISPHFAGGKLVLSGKSRDFDKKYIEKAWIILQEYNKLISEYGISHRRATWPYALRDLNRSLYQQMVAFKLFSVLPYGSGHSSDGCWHKYFETDPDTGLVHRISE